MIQRLQLQTSLNFNLLDLRRRQMDKMRPSIEKRWIWNSLPLGPQVNSRESWHDISSTPDSITGCQMKPPGLQILSSNDAKREINLCGNFFKKCPIFNVFLVQWRVNLSELSHCCTWQSFSLNISRRMQHGDSHRYGVLFLTDLQWKKLINSLQRWRKKQEWVSKVHSMAVHSTFPTTIAFKLEETGP